MNKRTVRKGLGILSLLSMLLPAAGLARVEPRRLHENSGKVALTGVTLIDGKGGTPKSDQTVVITDGRITDIVPSSQTNLPNNTKVIDLKGKFVMPGLIDSHVHLATRERSPELMKGLLEATLLGGVTSVRDMGGNGIKLAELTSAASRGEIDSPRVFFSAIMAGEGSRWFNGSYLDYASNGMPLGTAPWARRVNEKDDISGVIKDAKATGASAIKIYGSLSPNIVGELTTEAKRQGLKVWSHASVRNNKPGDLARFGVDSLSHADQLAFENIEHDVNFEEDYSSRIKNAVSTPVDSAKITGLLKLLKRKNIVLDDTLYIIALGTGEKPTEAAAQRHFDFACKVTKKAKDMGVAVAAGTDAIGGSSPNLHAELQILVERCGFTPLEAITAATLNGAKAIGVERELGTLEKGKKADLVVLSADPSQDIRNTQTVEAVMQDGNLYRRQRQMPTPPLAQPPVSDRITRVENGLLPGITIKGRSSARKLNARMEFYKTPAVSIAVINNGKIEWAKAYGKTEANGTKAVTIETRFQAGSISKPVAGMMALNLVERGKLALDENVNEKLRSWKVPENELTKAEKVTLRRILTHSAGLTVHGFDGYASDQKTPGLKEILDGEKPVNSPPIRVDLIPGSAERYSGGGFTVMQQLLTDTSNKPFDEFAEDLLFKKIGMSNSDFRQPLPSTDRSEMASGHTADGDVVKGKWHLYPEMAAAGLWSTPSDLAKLIIEVQRSAKGESNKILSKEMTTKMLTRQNPSFPNSDAGLGFFLKGKPQPFRFSHNGSTDGYTAVMAGFMETGQGAVVMTNSDDDGGLTTEILRSIAAEYGWNDMKPDEISVIDVDAKKLVDLAGVYKFTNGNELNITFENGKLFAAPPGRGKAELLPESETVFRVMVPGVPRVTFVRDANGEIAELILLQNGREEKGARTKGSGL